MPATRNWDELIRIGFDEESGLFHVLVEHKGEWLSVSAECSAEVAQQNRQILIRWKER